MNPQVSPVYSVAKLAKLSGMSEHCLRRWIVEGVLKAHTYSGTKRLFTVENLAAAQKAVRDAQEQKNNVPHRRVIAPVRNTKTIDEIFS